MNLEFSPTVLHLNQNTVTSSLAYSRAKIGIVFIRHFLYLQNHDMRKIGL